MQDAKPSVRGRVVVVRGYAVAVHGRVVVVRMPVFRAIVFVCCSCGADLRALKAMLEHEHSAQRPSNAISQ